VVVDGSWEFVLNDELLVFGNGIDSYDRMGIITLLALAVGIWKLE
jgi:hypothetical protein